MPVREFVPLMNRRVIIDHSKPFVEVCLQDLRALSDRYADVGERLEAIRESEARYSNLRKPLQAVILDFSQFMRKTIDTFEAIDGALREHQHEFTAAVRSLPRSH